MCLRKIYVYGVVSEEACFKRQTHRASHWKMWIQSFTQKQTFCVSLGKSLKPQLSVHQFWVLLLHSTSEK